MGYSIERGHSFKSRHSTNQEIPGINESKILVISPQVPRPHFLKHSGYLNIT